MPVLLAKGTNQKLHDQGPRILWDLGRESVRD